jgi:serine/threonine protein kinase
MTPERWLQVRNIFESAMELRPAEQAALLDRECADDAALRQEVDRLLSAEGKVQQEFLEGPPAGQAVFAMSMTSTMAAVGTRLGPYEIQALLGVGGMGEVYRARDTRLNRTVAVKMLPKSMSSDPFRRKRFEREARAISALQHPNICTLHDVGHQDGIDYLVMEYLDGETLAARLRKGSLAFDLALRYGIEIADALEAAHRRGVVHRDLKPGNIFLTAHGESKVLDFGLAKLEEPDSDPDTSAETGAGIEMITTPGVAMGTAPYMSPEQARGEELDSRTDIFSLGAVLYEMATGRMAFQGKTTAMVHKAILDDNPTPPSKVLASVPSQFDGLIARALAKDREQRYQEAIEIRADLLRLRREPEAELLAPVPNSVIGVRKPVTRLLYGLCVLLLLLFAVGGFFLLRKKPLSTQSRSAWVSVTDFADAASQPALSPDGRMVAFIRGPETFVTPGQIYVKILPNGQPVQLTHDQLPKMAPAFSPDGSRIAYTAVDPKFGWNTWVVPVLGGETRMLLPNAAALTWTDNANVLFSELKSGVHMALVAAAESRAGEKDVYLPANAEAMVHRSWLSPDGKWVLFSQMEQGGDWGPCRLVPFGGEGSVDIAGPRAARCTYAGWSPDSKTMYFSADAGDGYHIWRQPFPNGTPEQITFGATEEEGVAISPDGHSLITSAGIQSSTVWLRDSNGDRQISGEGFSTILGLGFPGGSCKHSVFAPDGKRIFYLVRARESPAMNAGELWTTSLESGESQPVLPGIAMSDFDISQDGRTIAFAAKQENGAWHTWLAPLDRRSSPRLVTNSEAARPCFGPLGELYFIKYEGDLQFLYVAATSDGEQRKVYPAALQDFHGVSPNGKWLLSGADPVVARRVPNGSPVRICAFCEIGWGPGGKILYLRFRNIGTMGGGRTVAIALHESGGLPSLQGPGLDSLDDIKHLKVIANIDMKDVAVFAPGPDPQTFAYSRITTQRNLFRIPID